MHRPMFRPRLRSSLSSHFVVFVIDRQDIDMSDFERQVKYRLSWLAHFQKPFAVSTVVLGLLLGAMGLRTALGSDVQK